MLSGKWWVVISYSVTPNSLFPNSPIPYSLLCRGQNRRWESREVEQSGALVMYVSTLIQKVDANPSELSAQACNPHRIR